MRLEIPIKKDDNFGVDFFQVLSEGLTDLKIENGKWPDQIQFYGNLGKEAFEYLSEKEWDLAAFNPKSAGGIVNKIVLSYSKPLTQIEDRGGTIFDEALNTKTVNGIPDSKTMGKIQSAYSSLAYTIERTVRPNYEIQLTRKK